MIIKTNKTKINSNKKYIIISSLLILSLTFLFSCRSLPSGDENTELSSPENELDVKDSKTTDFSATSDDSIISDNTQPEKINLSRRIADKGKLTATQLADYFLSQRQDYDYISIVHFAQLYVLEASVEGINSDVAFAQMCLETGYLRFGGLVQPEFHNYCGLGAMDAENPGCIFETEQLGVRAHIQHLQAYATHEDQVLHNELIDPRYSWVHKTKYIETIEGLTGTWATDPGYAKKIESILCRMEEMIN